jgi:4,5-dihydroxyphthalate decarboxylase
MKIKLSLACGSYDRTAALADGRVQVEGVDLNLFHLSAEETFFRMIRNQEFDVAEMSLSTYAMLVERGSPFVAIPVFPSRAFRHNGVYLNSRTSISSPEELAGRVVGVPEYQITAAVWIRGILSDRHGVPVDSISYRTGGLRSPGRQEKVQIAPPGIDIQPISPHTTLTEMLLHGDIDALYSPHPPAPFMHGDPRIRRLWPNAHEVEAQYFRETGIFPIMHAVVIRREVYEQNRWLARSLFKAFTEAKQLAEDKIGEPGTLANMLPFGYAEAARTRELMGADFWPYGLEPNRLVIDTLMRYMHEQGLLDRSPAAEELFAPETASEFKV